MWSLKDRVQAGVKTLHPDENYRGTGATAEEIHQKLGKDRPDLGVVRAMLDQLRAEGKIENTGGVWKEIPINERNKIDVREREPGTMLDEKTPLSTCPVCGKTAIDMGVDVVVGDTHCYAHIVTMTPHRSYMHLTCDVTVERARA